MHLADASRWLAALEEGSLTSCRLKRYWATPTGFARHETIAKLLKSGASEAAAEHLPRVRLVA
jgi:hypothetical protein